MSYLLVGFLASAITLIALGLVVRPRLLTLMDERDTYRRRAYEAEGRLELYEADDFRLKHPSQAVPEIVEDAHGHGEDPR